MVKAATKKNGKAHAWESRVVGFIEKPIELIQRVLALIDFAKTVYDPFCGSGTTVVAAEAEGRAAFGMELDVFYLATALERMKILGLEVKKIDA